MKVLKHDGSQHHGIGIRPTVPASRTRKGVAEGKDEILLRAGLRLISEFDLQPLAVNLDCHIAKIAILAYFVLRAGEGAEEETKAAGLEQRVFGRRRRSLGVDPGCQRSRSAAP
jgi:hypothetical protein